MNDRFKFRVYDEYANIMHYEKFKILPDGDTEANILMCVSKIMQCTGLKDKNGKLIYEGDIVKCSYGSKNVICNVVWDNEDLCFSIMLNGGFYSFVPHSSNDKIEILGNIWENAELLEG